MYHKTLQLIETQNGFKMDLSIIDSSDRSLTMLVVLVVLLGLIFIMFTIKNRKGRSNSLVKEHVQKKLSITWNLITDTNLIIVPFDHSQSNQKGKESFIELIYYFEDKYMIQDELNDRFQLNAFVANLQSLLVVTEKINYSLNTIDMNHISNSLLKKYGKISERDSETLEELNVLISNFRDKCTLIDEFQSIRNTKSNEENSENTELDFNFLSENKKDLNELINTNKAFIHSIKSYFE
ncbi:MAG: hypothetical protein ACPGU5_08335 [Lishizhenia sp.]